MADGLSVRALARSDAAAAAIAGLGAEPVPGELARPESIRAGASGCELAFHAAATVAEWGPYQEFLDGNVTGTRNALQACREAGVARFVHVGTEAALLAGQPLINVTEDEPLRPDSRAFYCATKARAEQLVRAANGEGFATVVVRPRLVWGEGDTTILPGLVAAVRSGRFRWASGGRHLTSTTHVDNAVEGLVLAAGRGRPGSAYFVTDGDPVVFRDFVTELLATQGIEIPDRSIPAPMAASAAAGCELIWRGLHRRGTPPITRMAYWLMALETTIDISLARAELSYRPVISIADGMAALSPRAPGG